MKNAFFDQDVANLVKTIPQVTRCSCCGSNNTQQTHITLAGFVMERMLNSVQLDDWLTTAIQCQDCQFIATVFRFTDEQMQRYYHEYMQMHSDDGRQHGTYVFHRRRNENDGWYKLAMAYQNPLYFTTRKNAVIRCLDDKIDIEQINSVLDYGGDLGQYIPDEFQHCRRHVVEIEQRKFVDGVTAVGNPADCEPVDLVMCCHTLEHVSYPNDLVVDMLQYLKPGGLLYLEVPNEMNHVAENVNNSKLLALHEHINIFYPDSLRALLKRNNIKTLSVNDLRYDSVNEVFSPALAIVGRKL